MLVCLLSFARLAPTSTAVTALPVTLTVSSGDETTLEWSDE